MNKSSKNLDEYEADLQIGPTDKGMVRFIITRGDDVINMDFEPEEALEIAEEIQAAANRTKKK